MDRVNKDRALFVAFFYKIYGDDNSFWNTFDDIYALSERFVESYDLDDEGRWEDESFEAYMDKFLRNNF